MKDNITSNPNVSTAYFLAHFVQLTPAEREIVKAVVDALATDPGEPLQPLDELALSLVKLTQELCFSGDQPVTAIGKVASILDEPVTAPQIRTALAELERRFSGYEVKPWEAQP